MTSRLPCIAKSISAFQLGRDLIVSYKTAFILTHKLREAMAADQAQYRPEDDVEIDGCHVGGHVKPSNHKANRKDRRLADDQSGKRRLFVVMRELQGRTLPFVVDREEQGAAIVACRIMPSSTVHADEASHLDAPHARIDAKRINHGFAYSSLTAFAHRWRGFVKMPVACLLAIWHFLCDEIAAGATLPV